MNWLQNINFIELIKCFVTGGLICVIGQILIDKTKLTPARILVIFVTTGVILGAIRHISIRNRFCWLWCNSSASRFWR